MQSEKTWADLGLSPETLDLISKAGFSAPTPVQTQGIPYALEGHDIIASSQTGSGKTASFVLPMVEKFVGRRGTYGLILAPTREIAQQIQGTLELFAHPRGVRSVVLIGGVDYSVDAQALQSYPEIIVATPGRLCDHLDRGNLWLDFIEVLVLDEADRMLDMGFTDQLARVTRDLPENRQTFLYSATIPPAVRLLADRTLKNPKEITIGRPLSAAKAIEQKIIWVREEDKSRALRRLLDEEKGSTIIFTRSKDGAHRVWRHLHSDGYHDATYLTSDRQQIHREQALAKFKSGEYRILVATDVAARGIHVDGVAHVINHDLPMEAEDYIHRIGRTGRIGASGKSTTLATQRDRVVVGRIEKLLGHPITEDQVPARAPREGRIPIPRPLGKTPVEATDNVAHADDAPSLGKMEFDAPSHSSDGGQPQPSSPSRASGASQGDRSGRRDSNRNDRHPRGGDRGPRGREQQRGPWKSDRDDASDLPVFTSSRRSAAFPTD